MVIINCMCSIPRCMEFQLRIWSEIISAPINMGKLYSATWREKQNLGRIWIWPLNDDEKPQTIVELRVSLRWK